MSDIMITGATGFIGRALCKKLNDENFGITIVTRDKQKAAKIIPFASNIIEWNELEQKEIIQNQSNLKSVIHLAGKNIMSSRWTKKHKERILKSRIQPTEKIIGFIKKLDVKPESFISASAVGYYGLSDTEIFSEKSPPGDDFLAQVVVKWENSSAELDKIGVRRVLMRTGIVLDKSGGILPKMILPFKLFLGGPLGSGEQWFPSISLDNLVNMYFECIIKPEISGPVNAVSGKHIKMKDFCKNLGKELNRPSYLKIPEFLLKIIFGEGALYITQGARTEPHVLKKHSF